MADYRTLQSAADFEDLLEGSRQGRLAILKHSTTCPLSSLAKNRLDRAIDDGSLDIPVYYLDLLRYRSVSTLIAERLGVRHESPQLIVVDRGEVVYHTSHLAIDPAAIPAPV